VYIRMKLFTAIVLLPLMVWAAADASQFHRLTAHEYRPPLVGTEKNVGQYVTLEKMLSHGDGRCINADCPWSRVVYHNEDESFCLYPKTESAGIAVGKGDQEQLVDVVEILAHDTSNMVQENVPLYGLHYARRLGSPYRWAVMETVFTQDRCSRGKECLLLVKDARAAAFIDFALKNILRFNDSLEMSVALHAAVVGQVPALQRYIAVTTDNNVLLTRKAVVEKDTTSLPVSNLIRTIRWGLPTAAFVTLAGLTYYNKRYGIYAVGGLIAAPVLYKGFRYAQSKWNGQ
jgi:hypothetical protein